MTRKDISRRRYGQLAGLSVVGALAGCVGNGGGDDDDADSNGDIPADDSTGTDDDAVDDDGERTFGDVFTNAESYEMEGWVEHEGDRIEMSGRVQSGNMYWTFEMDGQPMAWYIVDDQSYMVMQDQCFIGMMDDGLEEDEIDPQEFEAEAEAHPALEHIGRDVIDGEDVLVYEVSAGDAVHYEETITYYVSEDTGYLRRIEAETMQWDFIAWGEDVEPISPPDMECQEMPDGPPD